MDIKNFRTLVLDSPIKERLEGLEVVVKYEHLDFEVSLKGIQAIYKFVLDQVIGWNQIEKIPNYLTQSKAHFEGIKALIIQLAETKQSNHLFNNQWNAVKSKLSLNQISNWFIFLYDAPETGFIISVNSKDPNFTQGAIDYIVGVNINFSSSSKNNQYFTGILLAYEFKSQSDNVILQRRNSEKKSLSSIRNKYNEHIAEAEQQLNSYISDAKANLLDHFETVDTLKNEKDKSFEEWFSESQKKFSDFYELSEQSITENESLYREKLRLEAPAKYWNDRAVKLKEESDYYMKWLVGVSVISAILLFVLLLTLGNDFYETAFSDAVKGIKWSIILITIVSFLAVTLRILTRMTYSSLHLSRDAEEREQLTHYYLALKKDTTIEPEERQLILQSLFSRADTGLLKDDSGPTMPTSIIERIAK